ncbi:unnamed protein product [marine sediment metagenome]|uniref:Uncharacterized protein n=1 Tax=marine sediment metagenome TaxID=412755 RepID=X1QCM9_9ZZZZ
MELVDSYTIRFFIDGDPLIAPGEKSNAPVDLFFGAWTLALYDLFCPGPGVCPDDPGQYEKCEQYGDSERY